jgi:hypothetical protein
MKILFSTTNQIVSKIIRKGLNEPVSHVALQFENGIVVHSSMTGVQTDWKDEYLSENIIVYEIPIIIKNENEFLNNMMTETNNKKYDYSAFFYFCWRGLLKKIFKKPFPKKNKFGKNHAYICTELVKMIPDDKIQEKLKNIDLEMISPYVLYKLIKRDKKWI